MNAVGRARSPIKMNGRIDLPAEILFSLRIKKCYVSYTMYARKEMLRDTLIVIIYRKTLMWY